MTTYNTQNLIPLSSRSPSERSAISAKGGASNKGRVRFDQKACSKCVLPCPFKDQGTIEKWKCKVPDMKRLVLEAATDITKLDLAMIRDAWEIETLAKNCRDKKLAFDAKRELRQILAPEPQRIAQYELGKNAY
jgi:hypothetical protein